MVKMKSQLKLFHDVDLKEIIDSAGFVRKFGLNFKFEINYKKVSQI